MFHRGHLAGCPGMRPIRGRTGNQRDSPAQPGRPHQMKNGPIVKLVVVGVPKGVRTLKLWS